MWGDSEWDAEKATAKRLEFEAEQRRKHEEGIARRKAEREAARKAANTVPPAEYPWLKKGSDES